MLSHLQFSYIQRTTDVAEHSTAEQTLFCLSLLPSFLFPSYFLVQINLDVFLPSPVFISSRRCFAFPHFLPSFLFPSSVPVRINLDVFMINGFCNMVLILRGKTLKSTGNRNMAIVSLLPFSFFRSFTDRSGCLSD